jgi:hypothetical protein
MISVSCACGRKFKAEDHHAGKRTRCPVCGNLLVIGPAVAATPSAVNDNGEVPSWWFPTEGGSKVNAAAPTRSTSNPDDIQTVVLPPKQGSEVDTPASVVPPVPGPSSPGRLLAGVAGGLVLAAIAGLAYVAWPRGDGGGQPGQLAPANPAVAPDRKPPTPPEGTAAPTVADVKPAGPAEPPPEGGEAASKTALTAPDPPAVVPRPAPAAAVQLLIPAYFYPTGEGLKSWKQLIDDAAKVPVVAVANPANGPGEHSNPDYLVITQAASDAGVRVIGYIATSYGKRPLSEVRNEIDRWIDFYPQISGFFLDQQSSAAQDLPYYAKLRDHARQRVKGALIITNPGAMCDREYFVQGVADVICVVAGFQAFSRFAPPELLGQFSATRFAALVYDVPDAAAMQKVVKEARQRRIGHLFVGDSPQGANPYEKLPAYWDRLVEEVAKAR